MNKNVLIAIAVVVLLALGGAYFLYGRPSSPLTSTSGTPTTSSAKKSLKDLIALGSSQQCKFQDAAGNSGTMYVSGGKSRGDFTSTANGATVGSHMLYDGQAMYIWMDGQSQGYKSTLDATSAPDSAAGSQAMDVNQALDYDCSSWSVAATSFTPPAGIEFLDASAMLAPGTPGTGSSDQCAACASLTGDSQAQCLTTLNCN